MIEVRALTQFSELAEAVRLQKLIWGFDDGEMIPLRLFVTATKVGGQAFGAFNGHQMIGFCLAIPGIKAGGTSYLHSHMLGVVKEHRDSGIGRRLKLEQRKDALARGIPLIEWTFDPLQIKNAYFNIERLGAIVRRFVINQYGTTSSPLHGGLPTDRCVAEWWLANPRVEAILAGRTPERPVIAARIPVPAGAARAREIQQRATNAFVECFAKGLAVVGFERANEAGTYLLSKWESE
jgi:predicted GNAT superfamily acetyltransferase